MAKKIILGTDIARDAFKVKVNENFTELYDKDVALGEQINSLDANKANKTQEDWITATLENGWTGTLQYRKNEFGQIEIRGEALKAGTVTNNTTIATLPTTYQPKSYNIIPVYNASTAENIGVPLTLTTIGVFRINVTNLITSANLYFGHVCV